MLFADFETTQLPARVAHIVQISGEPGDTHRLYRSCHLVNAKTGGEELLPGLVGVVNNLAIRSCDQFAVHAAVVANGKRAVAVPADTGQGKTTLAAALVLAGFSYLSDEALILNDDGLAFPYPKPLALSPWSCRALGLPSEGAESLFTASDLGGKSRRDGVNLTDVIVARYGSGETSLERRPRSVAVSELISNSFNHYKDPERAFRLATDTARQVDVWELRYDSPLEAAALLRQEFG